MPYLLQDPDETLDYSCDWSDFLDDGGSPSDTISTSQWSIEPQTGSPQAPELSSSTTVGNVTTIFVSGCVRGETYKLTNRVVTSQGRTADRGMTILCEKRP